MKTTGFNSCKSWGIAVACCIVTTLIFIPCRLAGLLYVSFMERYNVNREYASYPILLCFSIRCFIGPFVSYMGDIFGYRAVILWGCVLGSAGFGACFFAEDIQFVMISLGVIYGMGLSMTNTLIPMVLKQHFNKHLTKANGITMSGFCASVFFMCPLYEHFVHEYGVNGAVLLTSGIMIQAIPAALVLKNPKYKTKLKDDISSIKERCDDGTEAASRKTMEMEFLEVELHDNTLAKSIPNEIISYPGPQVTLERETENVNRENPSSKKMCKRSVIDCLSEAKECSSGMPKYSIAAADAQTNASQLPVKNNFKLQEVSGIYHQCRRSEIDLSKTDVSTKGRSRWKDAWESLYVFIDPSFVIILFAQAFQGCTVVPVWTIMVDMARDKFIPHEQQIYLVQFLPVAEFIGFVSFGWVTDGGHLSYANFCSCGFVGLVLTFGFLVWSYNFITMMIGISLLGMTGSALTTAFPMLIYKYIDEQKQSMAIASRFIFLATLNFTLGPMIGYFRENLGSYDWILCILGTTCLVGSIMVIFLPKTASFTTKKEQQITKSPIEIKY